MHCTYWQGGHLDDRMHCATGLCDVVEAPFAGVVPEEGEAERVADGEKNLDDGGDVDRVPHLRVGPEHGHEHEHEYGGVTLMNGAAPRPRAPGTGTHTHGAMILMNGWAHDDRACASPHPRAPRPAPPRTMPCMSARAVKHKIATPGSPLSAPFGILFHHTCRVSRAVRKRCTAIWSAPTCAVNCSVGPTHMAQNVGYLPSTTAVQLVLSDGQFDTRSPFRTCRGPTSGRRVAKLTKSSYSSK